MGATTFSNLPLADEAMAWDGAAARARVAEWAGGPDKADVDWAKYAKAFAWVDTENSESFGAYKLPFSDVVDGKLCAVWKGVAACMAVMMGGRGGADIPDADAEKVVAHMAKYYDEFDKPVPEREAPAPCPRFEHVQVMKFDLVGVDEENRIIEGFASTPDLDAYHERILPSAFARDLPAYMANPIVTWAHDTTEIPPGVALEVRVDPVRGLYTRVQLGSEDPFIEQRLWPAIKQRRVRSYSVGFDGRYTAEWGRDVIEEDGVVWEWTRAALKEIAIVPLPANAAAQFSIAKSLGITQQPRDKRAAEDARVLSDLERMEGACEAIRNCVRHWAKAHTGAPSDEVVARAVSPITVLAEIVKAGKVLSATNRAAVEGAVESLQGALSALQEVLSRDGAGTAPPADTAVEESTPAKVLVPSLYFHKPKGAC